MSGRVVCEGTIVLPLLSSEAMDLFMALGERRWWRTGRRSGLRVPRTQGSFGWLLEWPVVRLAFAIIRASLH
jgi:hypothetical protein